MLGKVGNFQVCCTGDVKLGFGVEVKILHESSLLEHDRAP